ncbi:HAMP domain-containing protein [Bacillus licheniformis]|nr:HAMP domain-containing protein [Bacillus licheniformis]
MGGFNVVDICEKRAVGTCAVQSPHSCCRVLIPTSGRYFSEIKNKVTDMAGRVSDISEALSHFRRSSEEINGSVEHIAAISEESAAGSEEISASVHEQIEAARAGDAGKGFAVVAGEVKRLAEEVKSSVGSITEIVTAIQTETSSMAGDLKTGFSEVHKGKNQIEVLHVSVDGDKQMAQSLEQMNVINHVMEASVEKVSVLEEQTQSIHKLVEMITGMAEQTNLLALNASICLTFTSVSADVREGSEQIAVTVEELANGATNQANEAANISEQTQELTGQIQHAHESGETLARFSKVRQIKKNLKRVVAASEEIAKGHLNFEALDYKGKDEIGQLSQAVNHMGGSLREMIVEVSGIAAEVDKPLTLQKKANKLKEETMTLGESLKENAVKTNVESIGQAQSNMTKTIYILGVSILISAIVSAGLLIIVNAQDEKLTDYMKYSQEFADTAKKLKKELHSDEQLDMFDQIIENNHSLDEYFFSEIVPNVQQINTEKFGGKYGIIFFVMLTAFLTSVLITYGLLKDTSQTVQDTKSKNETAVQSAKLMSLYQNKYLHIPEYIINFIRL